MTTKRPSSPAAILKVQEAMELVEQAQHTLERACQKLCSVRYGADLYKKTGKLTDKVHSLWYVLQGAAQNRAQMSVDSQCPKCFVELGKWKQGDPPHKCTNARDPRSSGDGADDAGDPNGEWMRDLDHGEPGDQ